MHIDLVGKKALVTGASSGIGCAIAGALADAGAFVTITHLLHQGAEAESVMREITARGGAGSVHELDVTDATGVQRLFETLEKEGNGVDILVNNAGIVTRCDLLDIGEADWDRMLEVNLKGALHCAQQAARNMIRRGCGGRIINISSISGRRPEPRRVHYCVSKSGLEMLTKGLALELARYGITANAIAPGTIETGLTKDALADQKLREAIIARTPLGRLGVPADLAGAAVFLASGQAGFVTGQILTIDGGQTL
jgi:NAD(P)-dependent dehydrogenase (short-subunit alcohol dehydrogenase family)